MSAAKKDMAENVPPKKKESKKHGIEIDTVDFEDDIKVSKKEKPKDLFNIISFLVILAIFFGLFSFVSLQKIPKHAENVTELVNKTVYHPIPQDINFSGYISTTDQYYSNNVILVGFLKQEVTSINAGSQDINKYIVDDYDKKIELLLGYYASRDYESLFVTGKKTAELYKVYGLLRKSGRDLVLNVNKIELSERPTTNISSKELVEDAVEKIVEEHKILNYSHGLKRITCLFTC